MIAAVSDLASGLGMLVTLAVLAALAATRKVRPEDVWEDEQ